jgi:hypothetical protein
MKKLITLAILLIIPVLAVGQSVGGYYGPAPNPYLVYDLFTGVDGTNLPDHTPDVIAVAGWTSRLGTWQISGNAAVCTVSGGATINCLTSIDTGTPNYRVEVNIVEDVADSGIFVRLGTGNNTGYMVDFKYGAALEILEWSTSWTERAGTASGGANGVSYVVVNGTSITGYSSTGYSVNFAPATTNQTSSIVGLRSAAISRKFDTFSVRSN